MSHNAIDVETFFTSPVTTRFTPDGGVVMEARTAPGGRVCGSCQLCCKLVPVLELEKAAGHRCRHQRTGKGCMVYRQPQKGFPLSCGSWSCRWLTDPETAAMQRPDRSHYVIDVLPEEVKMQDHPGAPVVTAPAAQVWIDPAFPDAHKAPELRAYMAMLGERYRMLTIIRWDNIKGMVVCPPALAGDGQWHERMAAATAQTPLQHAAAALEARMRGEDHGDATDHHP